MNSINMLQILEKTWGYYKMITYSKNTFITKEKFLEIWLNLIYVNKNTSYGMEEKFNVPDVMTQKKFVREVTSKHIHNRSIGEKMLSHKLSSIVRINLKFA